MRPTARTRPWCDDEFIEVGKFKLVYTIIQGRLTVRLPGGDKMSISELGLRGYNAQYPRAPRTTAHGI